MDIKNKLRNSFLFPLLDYLRYFFKRYIIQRAYHSYRLFKGIKLKSVDDGINFFGYYNISPSNSNGDILYLKVDQENMRGSLYQPASIMLKTVNGTITKITETKAWNWQQGCMLQWLPRDNDLFIFNDYDVENDRYISKVANTYGKIVRTYDRPINNISKLGNYALSLNYERLATLRPDYGYFNINDKKNIFKDENDGIWYIDLQTGISKLIITIDQLKKVWSPTMEGAMHKVNHIDINPSGSRFMFLHRWSGPKGRFMRLITANPDGGNIEILNGDTMTSHSCWKDNNHIISFCNTVEYGDAYMVFKDNTDKKDLLSKKLPVTDGHPSISSNGKWLVTDTYPGADRLSFLYVYNFLNGELYCIGQFYQPRKYNAEKRIDLHPKWSLKGNNVFFESGHNNKRCLYSINLDTLLEHD